MDSDDVWTTLFIAIMIISVCASIVIVVHITHEPDTPYKTCLYSCRQYHSQRYPEFSSCLDNCKSVLEEEQYWEVSACWEEVE